MSLSDAPGRSLSSAAAMSSVDCRRLIG